MARAPIPRALKGAPHAARVRQPPQAVRQLWSAVHEGAYRLLARSRRVRAREAFVQVTLPAHANRPVRRAMVDVVQRADAPPGDAHGAAAFTTGTSGCDACSTSWLQRGKGVRWQCDLHELRHELEPAGFVRQQHAVRLLHELRDHELPHSLWWLSDLGGVRGSFRARGYRCARDGHLEAVTIGGRKRVHNHAHDVGDRSFARIGLVGPRVVLAGWRPRRGPAVEPGQVRTPRVGPSAWIQPGVAAACQYRSASREIVGELVSANACDRRHGGRKANVRGGRDLGDDRHRREIGQRQRYVLRRVIQRMTCRNAVGTFGSTATP